MNNKLIIKCNGENIDSRLVGNKAFNINKLISFGINTPETYVINSTVFGKMMEEILKDELWFNNDFLSRSIHLKSKVEFLQKKICDFKLDAKLLKELNHLLLINKGKLFAIRSSSTMEDSLKNSWAGQLKSYLNIKPKNIEKNILKCFSSIYSYEALRYGFLNGYKIEEFRMAVIIQDMVQPITSGVMFSTDPISHNDEVILIEAGYGLGEAVVSGMIDVDSFLLDKKSNFIMESRLAAKTKGLFYSNEENNWKYLDEKQSSKPCLTTKQLKRLGNKAVLIEKLFSFPSDIEWAMTMDNLYILQVRPITTIEKAKERLMVSHQSDLLTQDLVLSGVRKYCHFKKYGLSFEYPYIRYEHSSGDIFYPEYQVNEFENIKIEVEKFSEIADFLESEINNYQIFLNWFKQQTTKSENIAELISTFFNKSLEAVSTIPYFICFEIPLKRELEKLSITIDDIPSSKTEISKASKFLSELREKYKVEIEKIEDDKLTLSKSLEKDLDAFCSEFGYLGMLYFKGDPWRVIDALKMLIANNSIDSRKRTNREISIEAEKLLTISTKFLKLRTLKWEMMCLGCSIFREIFILNYGHLINYETILNYRIKDLLDLTLGNVTIKDFKNENIDFNLKITKDDVLIQSNYNRVSSIKKQVIKKQVYMGIVANKGIVKGIARIVLTPSLVATFNEGDILITKMSTPDFLPILEKASAFVTEIGGITSHAAIISRELGKPCIIGVKNITNQLIDGCLIEVNANEGIINILN